MLYNLNYIIKNDLEYFEKYRTSKNLLWKQKDFNFDYIEIETISPNIINIKKNLVSKQKKQMEFPLNCTF